MTARLTGWAASAALVLAALVLALGAAEGLLRLKHADMRNYDIEMWRYSRLLKQPSDNPQLGREHVPGASAVLQSVEIRINDIGLRGSDLPADSAARARVLFLGDSITMGWGVPEDETLTAIVERDLAAAGHPALVLNAGLANDNAARYVTRYFEQLAWLEPDVIVVHYFVNDADIVRSTGGNWLLHNSQLAVMLWGTLQRLSGPRNADESAARYRAAYAPDAPGFRAMKDALTTLAEHARKRNTGLILAMIPDVHALDPYRLDFMHDRMRALAGELGYRFVDLLPAFQGRPPEELWAMPGDPHPNALGHRLMAELLTPVIAGMLAARSD